jgi:tetratricopeptide (TPR) repeat protein
MAEKSDSISYLHKLASIFRDEGDVATANALHSVHLHPSSVSAQTKRRERLLIARADRMCKIGDFEKAVPVYEELHAEFAKSRGHAHIATLKYLGKLAHSLHMSREIDRAHDLYSRLHRIAHTSLGADHWLTRFAVAYAKTCLKDTMTARAVLHLEEQIKLMIESKQVAAEHSAFARTQRLYATATKLTARGKHKRALPLYQLWIDARLDGSDANDPDALHDIFRYATSLRNANEKAPAYKAYRNLVAITNRQRESGFDPEGLQMALSGYADCLKEFGDHASATATLNLAQKIV